MRRPRWIHPHCHPPIFPEFRKALRFSDLRIGRESGLRSLIALTLPAARFTPVLALGALEIYWPSTIGLRDFRIETRIFSLFRWCMR